MADVGFALAQAFVRIRPSSTGFRAEADRQIKTALAGVDGKIKLTVNSDLAKTKIAELRGYLTALTERAWEMSVGVDDKQFQLAMDRIFARLARLDTKLGPEITLKGIVRAQTELLALDVAMDKLDTKAVTSAAIWQGWATKLPLFAGAFGLTVGVIHLGVDVLVEFLAVLIPATVALVSFGIVGANAVQDITQQFRIFNTVGQAMGQNLLPLGGGLSKMQDAARPQVIALLGDALQVAGQKAGVFARLTRQAGNVLDQLASRATIALGSTGLSAFIRNAVPDLQKLGTVVGNVFGIIGNVLKSVPGYAGYILDFFVHLTRVIEELTSNSVAQWFLRLGLALHGVGIYAGLATTGLFLLGRPLGALAGSLAGVSSAADKNAGIFEKAKAGWQQLGNSAPLIIRPAREAGVALDDAGVAAGETAGKTGLLARAMGLLTPAFGWTALAIGGAVALGSLLIYVSSLQSATQKWAASLKTAIVQSASLNSVVGNTQLAVEKINTATSKAVTNYNNLTTAARAADGTLYHASQRLSPQQAQILDLNAAHQSYQATLLTENNRLNQLSRVFGSVGIAQGLMNQAGIKSSVIATDNNTQWQQDVQTLVALQNGLKAVAYSAGAAGNNERVMNYELSDQYTNVQKLNQAWDAYIGLITSTQGTLDTVLQGFTALGEKTGTVRDTLGKLSVTTQYAKTNLDALTPAGVALNQAFSQQVTNTNALIDSWRQAGLPLSTITTGVKAVVGALLPFAAHSQEAAAQLAALASEAGYKGPIAYRNLVAWAGKAGNAEKILKGISDQATIAQVNLTGAFEGTGNAIAQHLVGNIQDAILAYDGVYPAASAYGAAIAKYGDNSKQAHSAQQTLINDIIQAGTAFHQTNGQIATMISSVLHIPKSVALAIVMNAQGNYNVQGTVRGATIVTGGGGIPQIKLGASGFKVPGYGGGDRHPAMLEGGESVVPKHLTPMVAPLLAQHGVPGFASGVINYGNATGLGSFALGAYNSFAGTAFTALIVALRSTLGLVEQALTRQARAAGMAVSIYDQGGWLPPGASVAYNGTGRPERVGSPAQTVHVQLGVNASGSGAFERFMTEAITRWVWIKGGGNVQNAFGTGS